jgi:hypothetical protein
MAVLKKYLYASIAGILVFSHCQAQDEDFIASTDLGKEALADLAAIENHDKIKEDGSYYKVDSIHELPNRVKPGATIKIKKQSPAKDDPDKIIVIRDVLNPQTGSSIVIESADTGDGYYTVLVPQNSRSLEIEMAFLMASKDDKYALYKYWPATHTFEIEQDGENWVF